MNEPINNLSEKTVPKKASFECFICLEKRFIAFRPLCGHRICGVCVLKTFSTEGLHDKCGMCRTNLPENWDEYQSGFHNIADLKLDEFEIAARAAAREGDLPLVKNLLSQKKFAVGERVRVGGLQKHTGLNGREGAIKKLFATSARHAVQLTDGKCITIKPQNLRHSKLEEKCVSAAAGSGHFEILKFFAEEKADLDRADERGMTSVFVAAECGQMEIVKFLAEEKANLNRADDEGATPLLVAAQMGHIKIVKFLAEQKADLNRSNSNGVTPVSIAAEKGQIEVVKFLAEHEVDLDGADNNGATPVYIAAENGHIEVVKLLTENKADLNRANDDGVTLVCVAAYHGHTEIIKFLAEQKADLNRAKNNGVTPVHLAAYQGHEEIIKILAKNGADLNRIDIIGATPLCVAAYQGHAEIMQVLIEANAKVQEALLSLATTDETKQISTALQKK